MEGDGFEPSVPHRGELSVGPQSRQLSPTGSPPGFSGPLLSPKRTAREAGEDPPDDEHGPCDNADERRSDQQRRPSQRQNSDEQRKERDADGPQPRNLDASTVVRTDGYPDPRGAWPISTRRDDLRLGVGRLGLRHWLLLHHVIRMNVPESCGRWRTVDNEGGYLTSKGSEC